ncbi:hypothetical protein HDU97_002044 [Phlyctochytrium planicorne]|nr:hypothetical protein HDU97_002044 [Phlyctochytrium planicorne]
MIHHAVLFQRKPETEEASILSLDWDKLKSISGVQKRKPQSRELPPSADGGPPPVPPKDNVTAKPQAVSGTGDNGETSKLSKNIKMSEDMHLLAVALSNPSILASYQPGMAIISLARGELAYEPLFVLSGVTAGLLLEDSTDEGKHIPGFMGIAKFWLKKLGSIIPAVLSGFGAVIFSRYFGSRHGIHYSKFTHLAGVILDSQFYLLAPWAFKYLHKSHRGAAPRLVIAAACASGVIGTTTSLLFNLTIPRADGIPWAHALSGISTTQVPLRFPAFLAGLALAVERHRPGKGPSPTNMILGAGISAVLWIALLLTPPDLGHDFVDKIASAFRYPVCTLATYFALRPIIAFPPHLAKDIPWRRKLHNVLSHPITEAVTLVTLTAEMVHKEVSSQLLGFLRITGFFNHDAVPLADGTLFGLWGAVAAISAGLGYGIYVLVQKPSLGFARRFLEKKWKKA